jgi:hypothetical protein
LIEVLLALGIFLMSLVAIGRLVDMGMDREIDSRMQLRGSRLAQSKMADVISGYLPLSSASGTFEKESDWSWNIATQQQSQPNLYLVTITVSRDNRGQKFEFTLAQMVIDPLYMGSGQPATSTTDAGSATSAIYGNGTSSGGTP